MTKLLEQGIDAVRGLPAEQQDAAGELLLSLANAGGPRYRLTPEQIEGVKEGLAQAERGEFLSEQEMSALWRKFGL